MEEGGELTGVGQEEIVVTLRDVAANSMTVKEAVAEETHSVHVTEGCSPGAEEDAGLEISVALQFSAAVKMDDRQGEERRRMLLEGRHSHKREANLSIP